MNEFDLLKTKFRGDFKIKDLIHNIGKTVRVLGNYIAYKHVTTIRGERMAFGTFTDEDGTYFDTTNFPPSLKQYPFKGWGVYLIQGKVTEEFGYATIEVEKMAKLSLQPDPRYT